MGSVVNFSLIANKNNTLFVKNNNKNHKKTIKAGEVCA